MDQSTRAHRAGFNCNKEFAVSKAMVTNGCTRFTESGDLGVCSRIGVDNISIPSSADDLSVANDDSADWNFSEFEGSLGAAEGFLHPELVAGATLIRALGIDLRGSGIGRSWSLWAQGSSADHSTDSRRGSAEQGKAKQRRVNTRYLRC
jgi:hypothetical protein